MGKREARPRLPKTVIITENFCMTEIEKQRLIERLRAYVEKSEFKQNAIAEGIGRSSGYVSNLLAGKCDLTVKDMVFLCRLTRKDPSELLSEVLQESEYSKKHELESFANKLPQSALEEYAQALSCLSGMKEIVTAEIEKRKK